MNRILLRCTRVLLASGVIFCFLALTPIAAQAQAWLPEKGSSSLSLDFSNVLNKKHYNALGNEVFAGHTDLEILSISGSYSPADRWLINFSLPYVKSRYRGPFPHPTAVDNGSWHQKVTDLQFSLHYQLVDGPIAFSPYIGAIIPTQSYETMGHAAPGRGLDEYWVGFYTAMSLNEWIPRTYVQLRGNYAFVEKVANISHDRTNASIEIGYFLNQSWSVRALYTRQWTHGGIDVPVPPTSPLFPFHDQLAAEELTNVGGGVSWIINDRVSAYGLYVQSISGENAHKVDHRLSMGVSYGLGGH